MQCLKCGSVEFKKFGKDKHGNPRVRCKECGATRIVAERPLGAMRIPLDDAAKCIHLLLEGTSIRSVERLTGVNRNTLMALVVHVGQSCIKFLENTLVDVCVDDIQADEVWSFVGMKEKRRSATNSSPEFGDAYTFVGIERTTKLIVAWHLGKRSHEDTVAFAEKLKRATDGRFQLTTDGFLPYRSVMPETFGSRIDYMQLIKQYGSPDAVDQRRYSPPTVTGVAYEYCCGHPEMGKVCTSHIERSNLSVRMAVRRFTRLTNAFSKKWENHQAMLGLWFAFYNFCRKHMTLKETPAMAAGLSDHVWSIRELIQNAAKCD